MYETLMTREELARCEDSGDYFKISPDVRDLNYEKYFSVGEQDISSLSDYNSSNTRQLSRDEIKEVLLGLEYIQNELGI